MAKELPWFKFEPSTWLSGEIAFEEMEVQGLFINICAAYWERSGEMKLSYVQKRWNKPTALDSLLGRFISVNGDSINIKFLDIQLQRKERISVVNSGNGSKGGRPSIKDKKPTALNSPNEKKAKNSIREEEIREENTKVLHPLQEWLKKECPTVCKMKKPITFEEAVKIVRDFPDAPRVEKTFYSMENSVQLLKKYQSANLTVRNWLNRDQGPQPSHSTHKGLA